MICINLKEVLIFTILIFKKFPLINLMRSKNILKDITNLLVKCFFYLSASCN